MHLFVNELCTHTLGQNGGNLAFLFEIIVVAYLYDWKTI